MRSFLRGSAGPTQARRRAGAGTLLALVLLAWSPGPAASQIPETLAAAVPSAVVVVDSLVAAGALEEAWTRAQARLEVEPDDAEARVRAVQVALSLGIMGGNAELRLRWLRAAELEGRRLLPLRPDDPEAMAWAAASRGRLALAEDGARTTVRLAEEVWRITDELLALAPAHPLGNHVRGKLHQEAMRLSPVKRFLARVFLGFDLAGKASWEGAEEHLGRAVAGAPGMVLFHLDLGDAYRDQGKHAQALESWRRGLACPDSLPVDAHFKELLRRRIRRSEAPPGP